MNRFKRFGRALPLLACALFAARAGAAPLGTHVVLVWNDLGMHCMNQDHSQISILPPYNTLVAQVIERGDATTLPHLITVPYGLSLEYSIPGNTYSAGKTNFWDYAQALFGVPLPPNVGLTGLGLTGAFTSHVGYFAAEGIPVTPFPDAAPTVEDPFQQALVILRDSNGVELCRSQPVIPVSTEVNCVSMNCHTSVTQLVNQHEREGGFDPNATPILCAQCHGSTPLTGPFPGTAGWFSLRIHEQHSFIDQDIPGINGCYKCHPGPNTRCLRDVMATQHGLVCQDCHGTLRHIAQTIDAGRVPWVQEPACRDCHTSTFGEPVGTLYRNAVGHGGVRCSACHGSPHAIFPSREARDNANMMDLQGHAGVLNDCTVCHGVRPSGAGPHGSPTQVVEAELFGGAKRLETFPNPVRTGASVQIRARATSAEGGYLLVFDASGRTVCRLDARSDGADGIRGEWNVRNARGGQVAPGVYFVRWTRGAERAAGRVVVLN
ncbi:MAG: multiheme c-type cytochrome [bacterium]